MEEERTANPGPVFTPQLTRDEAVFFSERYDASEDAEVKAEAAGAAIRGGDFSPVHLRTIFWWKARDRGKSRLCHNTEQEVRDAFSLAMRAQMPRSAIAVLTGLDGVGVPVASAIMTAIHPEAYTILDFRALQALGKPLGAWSVSFYLAYLAYCTKLAKRWDMPLRSLDRGLWQWSKERDLSHQSGE